jgi:hypothetical protein
MIAPCRSNVRAFDLPDRARLERRYEQFRQAAG